MDTWGAWVPNLVCTVAGTFLGLFLSWFFNHKAAEVQQRMLTTALTAMESSGQFDLELVRDKNGELTGGKMIRLRAVSGSKSSAGADLTAGPTVVAGKGENTSK